MQLYSFFRSGTSHRTRIALNLKGVQYDYVAVSLAKDQHLQADYKAINPQGLVPALVVNGKTLVQSPAIIEWLEETYPEPALLPKDTFDRATVRAMAALIGCDIHPINNRRILQYLKSELGHTDEETNSWAKHWIITGFDALEQMLAKQSSHGFCFGESPTIADIYLIPQVESARRFNVDMRAYPLISAIDKHCNSLEAFSKAAPSNQSDAF